MTTNKQKKKWLKIVYNGCLLLAVIYFAFYILVDAKVIFATQPVSLVIVAIAVGLAPSIKKFIEAKLDEKKDDNL